MKLGRRSLSFIFIVLLFAPCAVEAQTVTLEYKLKPGQELRMKETMELEERMSLKGKETESSARVDTTYRAVVTDVDRETGAIILGCVASIRMTTKTNSRDGPTSMTREQQRAGVIRLDRFGKPIPGRMKQGSPGSSRIRMMLQQLDQMRLPILPLPPGPVKVGDTWQITRESGALALPTPSRMTSTIVEIKEIQAHNCAIIKSKILPLEKGTGLDLSGTVEGVFDIDRGVLQEVKVEMMLHMKGEDRKNDATTQARVSLVSLRMLPPDEFAAYRRRIRSLDAAIGLLHNLEVEKAIGQLEKLGKEVADKTWQRCIQQTLALAKQVEQVAESAKRRSDVKDSDYTLQNKAEKMFMDAEGAADAGEWEKAAEAYMDFVEAFPKHRLVSSALAGAGEIFVKQLKEPKGVVRVVKKLSQLAQEKLADNAANPLEIYKLAGTCERLADSETAVKLYQKFIARKDENIPPRIKLMAQYRTAELLAKLGKKQEALVAYRAVGNIPAADDDYAKQLKAAAKKKAEELVGGQ